MDYVNRIKRIIALVAAYNRASDYAMRHSNDITIDIDFKFQDKIAELQSSILAWVNGSEIRKVRVNRRKQLNTACRLLKADIYQVLR
jgi:hypothetical protein